MAPIPAQLGPARLGPTHLGPAQLGPAQLGPVRVGPPASLAAGPGPGGTPPTWGPPPAGLDWSDVSSIPDLATNRHQLVALALCLVLFAVTVVVALTLSMVTQGPVSMSPLWGGIAPLLHPGG
ncbi:MAG TPA: hypothetical protein VH141_30390 [Pseudonocardia sp.]|nr:hypothetical protein [Pseudonocardia sp.]